MRRLVCQQPKENTLAIKMVYSFSVEAHTLNLTYRVGCFSVIFSIIL